MLDWVDMEVVQCSMKILLATNRPVHEFVPDPSFPCLVVSQIPFVCGGTMQLFEHYRHSVQRCNTNQGVIVVGENHPAKYFSIDAAQSSKQTGLKSAPAGRDGQNCCVCKIGSSKHIPANLPKRVRRAMQRVTALSSPSQNFFTFRRRHLAIFIRHCSAHGETRLK